MNRDTPIVEMLVLNGIDINKKDNEGIYVNLITDNTPLHIAINNELNSIVELLIKKGADLEIMNNEGVSFYYVC